MQLLKIAEKKAFAISEGLSMGVMNDIKLTTMKSDGNASLFCNIL